MNGTLQQLDGKRIGAATGTTFDAIVQKTLPEAEIVYINSAADLIAALEAGKIDGFAVDEPAARQFCRENPRLAVLDEYMDTFEFGFVLPRTAEGEALLEELDAWLISLKADDGLEQLIEKWANGPEEEKTLPDYDAFPAPKGILTLATEGDYVPMTYYRGSRIVGAEIDLAARFCEANGYGLEIKVMNFDGILPAVQSGKADIAAAGITITDERRESVNFSVPYYAGGTVMVVLKDSLAEAAGSGLPESNRGFPDSIISSFNKTFVREGRWQLFVDGVLTTLLITLLTILFGTLLGFSVFMLCRNGNAAANLITRFCMWLIQGMPMVVLLMILCYVIFSSVAISSVVVAIMGFTLTFGASVFGLLKMGVGALDKGQYEAAYALGYSNLRTFFRIILPQALPHVLPAYKGEIVGLIKATAIVGYIAVQDLTKMGDIVRSRTYEAFFPLIAITIIYFALEGLIGFFISRISVGFNPRRRKPANILKEDGSLTAPGSRSFIGGKTSQREAEKVVTAPQPLRSQNRQMIRIEHLKKAYPNVTPLQDVSVEIRDGDVISVIGPSGTGKSTLLRCINQLEKPTSGRVWVDGMEITDPGCDINKVRRKMGMVFQNFNLFGHRTVIENIMMAPMDLLGRSKQEACDTGMRLLRTVGLAEKALNYPDELSGGQKQRIAIARTLAMDPDVILLDEPTSALDPTMVGEVQAVIRDLAKSGKTMMIVTHEMSFARAISNRVFYMDEGGIYEDGSPEQIFSHPLRENTRRFVRRLKVLELNIESHDYDFLGMAGRIEAWCSRNQVASKQANRVQLVFEETMQLLVPALENPRVQAICEYSEQAESAEWTLHYAGPRYDMTAAGDGLALAVLKGMTQSMEYTWSEGTELPNRLRLILR